MKSSETAVGVACVFLSAKHDVFAIILTHALPNETFSELADDLEDGDTPMLQEGLCFPENICPIAIDGGITAGARVSGPQEVATAQGGSLAIVIERATSTNPLT